MVLSRRLIEEMKTAMARPKFRRYFPEAEIPKFLSRLLSASAFLAEEGEENPRSFVDGPKDDYLIELALATNSDVIVSGDRHLHDPAKNLPVRVVRPADFLEELENA